MKKGFLFVVGMVSVFGFSQNLQLKDLMKGNEFIGHQPENHRFSADESTIVFDWNPSNEPGASTYFATFSNTKPQKLNTAFSILDVPFQQDQLKYELLYVLNQGVLYSYSKSTKKLKKILQLQDKIQSVYRSLHPEIIFINYQKNVYKLNTKDFSMVQITNFMNQKAATKPEIKSTFLEKQQTELFDYIKDEKQQIEWEKKDEKRFKEVIPNEIFYDKSVLEQVQPNPNGNFVTFRLSNYPVPNNTNVEQFITDNGATQHQKARPKVGISNFSTHKFGIYNVQKDTCYFVSYSKLTGKNKQPIYFEDYTKKDSVYDAKIVMQNPIFNDEGTIAIQEIRSQDNKHRWIVQLDLEEGTITELEHQEDPAWIGGPGIPSYSFSKGTLGFIDANSIYFQSEITGFSHLYALDLNSKKKTALTSGNWEVRKVQLSNNKKFFYLTTNATHPGNRSFYKLEIATKKLTGIFTNDGAFEVVLSPDEKHLLVRYSYKNKPWELYLSANQPNAPLKQITFSTSKEFKNYSWNAPEVISFSASDGTKVYARIYEPKASKKNNAAIIFVHGAGYLQNAHNYWSNYQREYLFHHLLIEKGYTVLDIDYRGSDGYGRDFRTGIYRFMGGKDLTDHLDGKALLVSKYQIHPDKIGIYGGSYGGFITLMALLTKPGEFKAGAALRSVTDWAHYNNGYTSNILNFPETDELAYRKSSPIYHANNLKDNLLMLHGMVDDNVQFQDIVRLSQRFIELQKKNWDLAVYPVEAHGFTKTTSWIDEYTRILDFFEKNLR